MKTAIRLCVIVFLTSGLGGCLLLSPYHGQIISSRTQTIPFQAWTSEQSASLNIECMPTNRFGPDYTSYGPWGVISSIPVSDDATLDLVGTKMYSASKLISLPNSCWYLNQSNGWYYTSLRVIDESSYSFFTVDREGIRCASEAVADSGRWFSWYPNSCHYTYSNSNKAVRWITIRTSS